MIAFCDCRSGFYQEPESQDESRKPFLPKLDLRPLSSRYTQSDPSIYKNELPRLCPASGWRRAGSGPPRRCPEDVPLRDAGVDDVLCHGLCGLEDLYKVSNLWGGADMG